jgi:hypothetical protein
VHLIFSNSFVKPEKILNYGTNYIILGIELTGTSFGSDQTTSAPLSLAPILTLSPFLQLIVKGMVTTEPLLFP